MLAHPVSKSPEIEPQLVTYRSYILLVEIQRVHKLAVNVELELLIGGVPDANGAGSLVAFQVIQDLLGESAASVYPINRLERTIRIGIVRASIQKRRKLRSFIGEADPQQAIHREGGVSDPNITIVPISNSAGTLGQTARGRRDDRAGRFVGKQLQHQSRPVHHFTPAATIGALREPPAPI